MNPLAQGIANLAKEKGLDPIDIATAMSYETGGTLDPWQQGPSTSGDGEHIGLIQMGANERAKYGYHQNSTLHQKLEAVGSYLTDRGVKPGMGLLQIYSAINAGHVGMPGAMENGTSVADKVQSMMGAHRRAAQKLMTGVVPNAAEPIQPMDKKPPKDFKDTYSGTNDPLDMSFAQTPISWPKHPDDEQTVSGDPGTVQLAIDAFKTSNSIGALFDNVPEANHFDPDFHNTPALVRQFLSDDLDPKKYTSWFENAGSMDQMKAIREYALENQRRHKRLAQAGLEGTALSLAAGFLDPVAIGAGLATEGVGTAAIEGARLSKASYLLYNTALGSASGASAVEATTPFIPDVNQHSVLTGAILGGALGTVAGALGRNPAMDNEAAQFQTAVRQEISGKSPEPAVQFAPESSAGAKQVINPDQPFLSDTSVVSKFQDQEVPKTYLSALRGGWGLFDIGGALRSSENPAARWLGTHVTKDAADPTVMTGTEDQTKFADLLNRSYYATYNSASRGFLQSRGVSFKRSKGGLSKAYHDAMNDFHEATAKYVRDRRPDKDDFYPEPVQHLGKKIEGINKTVLDLAKNPLSPDGLAGRSIAGFEELEHNANYLMRQYDAKKLQMAREAYGDAGIASAFEQAMLKVAPEDADRALVKRAAKAFGRAVTERAYDLDTEAARKLGSQNMEEVIEILKDLGGLDQRDAEMVLRKYRLKKGTEAPARGKQRLFMDETADLKLPNKYTGEIEHTTMQDLLLVNDAHYLTGKYIHQMSGRIAMARMRLYDPKTGELVVNGLTSDHEVKQLLEQVKRKGVDSGQSSESVKRDMDRFQYLFDHLAGRPKHPHSPGEDWFRMFERLNYVRVMNQAGFAQLPEIAGVITTAGLKAFFTHMPTFRRIMEPGRDADLVHQLSHDLETFIAYGTDRFSHHDFKRIDEMSGDAFSLDRGRFVDKANAKLEHLSRWTSDMSGMNIVNMALQRSASMSMVQKFVDMAYGESKLFTKGRMKSLGLNDEMSERIFNELRNEANVETIPGALTKRKIKRMNFDSWKDMEAREAFRDALFRSTRQMIQTNDIGMMSKWMSHPMGRIFVQFRRFIFGAFTNNLLYNANMLFRHGDMRALSYYLLSTLMSGMAYAMWQEVKTVGMSDRQKYLKKMLSFGNMAKASWARTGWSSILPMLLDSTIDEPLTGEQQFSYRSSGQPADVIFGNPTFGGVSDLVNAISAVTHPLINERGMTQKEARDFARIFPFSNAIPAVVTLNTMTQGLDKYPPKSDFGGNNNK